MRPWRHLRAVSDRFSSSSTLLVVLRDRRKLPASEETSTSAAELVATRGTRVALVGPPSRPRTPCTTALSGSSPARSVRKRTASCAQSRKPIICSASSSAAEARRDVLRCSRSDELNILQGSLVTHNTHRGISNSFSRFSGPPYTQYHTMVLPHIHNNEKYV